MLLVLKTSLGPCGGHRLLSCNGCDCSLFCPWEGAPREGVRGECHSVPGKWVGRKKSNHNRCPYATAAGRPTAQGWPAGPMCVCIVVCVSVCVGFVCERRFVFGLCAGGCLCLCLGVVGRCWLPRLTIVCVCVVGFVGLLGVCAPMAFAER